MTVVENRYLEGNFAPVTEEVTATNLPVTGTIPASLQGRFLRNGPNPIGAVDPATYHWFGGEGMVHGVRLADGKADWYRNRWVHAGKVLTELNVPDPGGAIHSDMDFAANTNVIGHAGKTLAIVEAGGRPIELSYELETLRRGDFDGTLPNGFTAHPKRDPKTGELHAVCYWWGLGNQVQYIVVDTYGQGHARSYRSRRPARRCCTTWVCQSDTSSCSTCRVCSTSTSRRLGASRTSGTRRIPARIGVMPRDGGNDDVQWFDIDPCYIFHPMNTFDDGDRVVFDAVRHPRMFANELTARTRACRRSTGGPSISRTARSSRSVSTIVGRSSPATTSASSASRTATATRSPPDRTCSVVV